MPSGVTGADSFAVLMPDNWFDAGRPAIAQVHASFAEWGLDAIGLTRVAHRDASRYGNVGGVELLRLGGDCHRVLALQGQGYGLGFRSAAGERCCEAVHAMSCELRSMRPYRVLGLRNEGSGTTCPPSRSSTEGRD